MYIYIYIGYAVSYSPAIVRKGSQQCLCVLRVGPLCGASFRWCVLCGVFPSVLVHCGWGPYLSCFRFPWHLFLVLPLARARAHAVARRR